jgi:hypothetical protein
MQNFDHVTVVDQSLHGGARAVRKRVSRDRVTAHDSHSKPELAPLRERSINPAIARRDVRVNAQVNDDQHVERV